MKSKAFALSILFLLLFTSCSNNEDVASKQRVKPVKIIKIQEENRSVLLNYIGMVAADEIRKIAFKSSGKIEKVFVEKGEKIKKEDILVKLDTKDLEYDLEASKASMEAAKLQYEKSINGASDEEVKQAEVNVKKAQDVCNFSRDNYNKVKALFDKGAVSQSTLDKAKLDMDISELELTSAKEFENKVKDGARQEDKKTLLHQMEKAKIDYDYKQDLLESAVLEADVDGYVVDVLYKEGEMTQAGYPVVMIRNEDQIVNVGLSQSDISKVKLGDKAILKTDSIEGTGKISNISQVPNPETMTYNIEISIEKNIFQLGSIVDVQIIIGEEKGVWIPITSILSNGIDYVFVVREEKAFKKEIEIEEIQGSRVKINGLSAGEKLVIEGMKRLRNDDKIIIQK